MPMPRVHQNRTVDDIRQLPPDHPDRCAFEAHFHRKAEKHQTKYTFEADIIDYAAGLKPPLHPNDLNIPEHYPLHNTRRRLQDPI